MRKLLSTLLIISLIIWFSHAELIYDEATNSYINTNATTQSSVTTSLENSSETTETSSENSNNTEDSETVNDPQTQISSISNGENDTTSNQSERSWTLEYMHEQVDNHHTALQKLLVVNYKELLNDSEALSDSDNNRLFVLQCLSIVDDNFDYIEDIKKTFEELKNEITIVTTDLHSDVTALETKIDESLLSSLNQNLQIWSLQNKIDAYNAEYTNVVEMYYELSLDEVANADELIQEWSTEYKEVVAVYDKRVGLYDALEKDYTNFLEKSSIAGAVTGPNIQQLVGVLDALETYYMAQYMEKWEGEVLSHIPANNKAFIEEVRNQSKNAFSAYFNAEADSLLYGLYPVEDLQNINKWVLTIRSAFLYENGTYDCKAFVENNSLETQVPALQKDMSNLLKDLNEAANNIVGDWSLPKNADELADLLVEKVKEEWFSDIDALISQELARIEKKAKSESISRVAFGVPSSKTKRKSTVRTFLQKNYKNALEQDRLVSFTAKLQRAHTRVESALAKNPTGQTLDMLEAIGEVIEEFL